MAKAREYTYTNPLTGQPLTLMIPENNPNVAYAINYLLNNGNDKVIKDVSGMKQYFKDNNITYYSGMYDQAIEALALNGITIKELNDYYKDNPKNTDGSFTRSNDILDINNDSLGRKISNNVDSKNDDVLTFEYVDPYTGEMREGTIGDSTAYKYNKVFNLNSTNSSVYYAIEYMLKNGQVDSSSAEEKKALKAYLESKLGKSIPDAAVKNSAKDALTFFNTNDIPLSSLGDSNYYSENSTIDSTVKEVSTESKEQPTLTEREAAEDYYWNQLYDLEGNTLGADIYNRLTQAEQNAAMSNMQLAEAQYQQAAMDQAAVIKSITDQVKAERMAKLKAGMNEAQIANQDMQIMLNNMNTLNQQVNTLNQNRLAAQQQYNLAQDTAYQQYLNSAAGMAQAAAGFTAAGAGDATRQSLLNMYYTDKYGNIYKKANQNVTGQTTNTGGNK